MRRLLLCALTALLLLSGCSSKGQVMDGDGMVNSYKIISQSEAKEMMQRDDGHVVVDVRRQDEYDAGHIPGAILIPNESIDDTQPKELPDFNQIILIYCRSGNRSKQAAQKLFDMGYTRIYEFGGINTWDGEIVTENAPQNSATPVNGTVSVSYESFDGGGPEFSVRIDDPEITSCESRRRYREDDHEQMTGAGYEVIITFTALKAGETTATISARSPIAENFDAIYAIQVDDAGNIALELQEEKDASGPVEAIQPAPTLVIEINDIRFYASPEDNSSAQALVEKLSTGEMEIDMHDYGGFEKVGELPWTLPRNDASITTKPGDILLYQGNQLTIYYDENTWSFTRLAALDGVTKEELLDVFGDGDVTVKLWVEWTE